MSDFITSADRMAAGHRGIDEPAAGLVDHLAWGLGLRQYLVIEGVGFGAGLVDGLVLGAPRVGPDGATLGRSPGLKPVDGSAALARARNLATFGTGLFLSPPWVLEFAKGLGVGFWNELTGLWELGAAAWSGIWAAGAAVWDGTWAIQLETAVRQAFAALERRPEFGFALGQQIGGNMVKNLLTAAEGDDFGAFCYAVGELLGPYLLDILGAIISGGAGPLLKYGVKASVEVGGELAGALVRRVRSGFDELVEAAGAALPAGPRPAFADGAPSWPDRVDPPVWLSERTRNGISPTDRGLGSGGRTPDRTPSGPEFSPTAAAAGAAGTEVARRIQRAFQELSDVDQQDVVQILRDVPAQQGPVRNALLDSASRVITNQLDPALPRSWARRMLDANLSFSPEQLNGILDTIRRESRTWVGQSFQLAEALFAKMNHPRIAKLVGPEVIEDPWAKARAGHNNSTVGLSFGCRPVSGGGMIEFRLVHAHNVGMDGLLRAFPQETQHLLPAGFRLGDLAPDARLAELWADRLSMDVPEKPGTYGYDEPPPVYDIWEFPTTTGGEPQPLHGEMLGALELDRNLCPIGALATSLNGCSSCQRTLSTFFPSYLHLDPS